MSVKIRLARRGRKKLALFDVIIADSRSSRDGRFIEKIGIYNPNTNPATIEINEQKAFEWVMKGAEPTDTVKAMLSYKGILYRKHLQIGVLKGALTQEEADKKLNAWIESKQGKIDNKKQRLAADKEKAAKAKLEAELKVNAAREESLKNKNKVEEAAPAEEAPAAEAEVSVPEVTAEAENTGAEATAAE